MPKKIKINVTARDIKNWINNESFPRKTCTECAVAKATRRHKGMEKISVSYFSILSEDSKVKITLPYGITEKIRKLDNNIKLSPFSFEVEVPWL